MYGEFVTLLMLAGIVVIIALVPRISEAILQKNIANKQSELRKKSRYIDIYFLIVFMYFFVPTCTLNWPNSHGVAFGASLFCLDVAAVWLCKHHYFCYALLLEQQRRGKKHNRKRLQKLPKAEPKELSAWYDWYFHKGLYNNKYPNHEELDYQSTCVVSMMFGAGMCALLTLAFCGALIGFGTIFTGLYKFWCSTFELLWYNLQHIDELPLNVWFHIAVAACVVLLVLTLAIGYKRIKKVFKKS